MLQEGKHKVEIIGSFTGESSEKKTPYIGVELETEDGEFIEWVGYMSDKEFTKQNGEISTMTKENLKTLLQIGFQGKKIADLSNADLSITDLFAVNPKLTVTIKHEDYENAAGEIKKKPVVHYFDVGFGVEKADHKKSVQIFKSGNYDSVFNGLKGKYQKKAAPVADSKPESTEGHADEDIPF